MLAPITNNAVKMLRIYGAILLGLVILLIVLNTMTVHKQARELTQQQKENFRNNMKYGKHQETSSSKKNSQMKNKREERAKHLSRFNRIYNEIQDIDSSSSDQSSDFLSSQQRSSTTRRRNKKSILTTPPTTTTTEAPKSLLSRFLSLFSRNNSNSNSAATSTTQSPEKEQQTKNKNLLMSRKKFSIGNNMVDSSSSSSSDIGYGDNNNDATSSSTSSSSSSSSSSNNNYYYSPNEKKTMMKKYQNSWKELGADSGGDTSSAAGDEYTSADTTTFNSKQQQVQKQLENLKDQQEELRSLLHAEHRRRRKRGNNNYNNNDDGDEKAKENINIHIDVRGGGGDGDNNNNHHAENDEDDETGGTNDNNFLGDKHRRRHFGLSDLNEKEYSNNEDVDPEDQQILDRANDAVENDGDAVYDSEQEQQQQENSHHGSRRMKHKKKRSCPGFPPEDGQTWIPYQRWVASGANFEPKFAYVTYISSSEFSLPAAVLMFSIANTGSQYARVVCVTKDISQRDRSLLSLFAQIIEIEKIASPLFVDNARYRDVFTKLRMWQLEMFTKVVWIDTDVVIRKNIDVLFDLDEWSVPMDAENDRYSTGMMVLQPSYKTFAAMMYDLNTTSVSMELPDLLFLKEFFERRGTPDGIRVDDVPAFTTTTTTKSPASSPNTYNTNDNTNTYGGGGTENDNWKWQNGRWVYRRSSPPSSYYSPTSSYTNKKSLGAKGIINIIPRWFQVYHIEFGSQYHTYLTHRVQKLQIYDPRIFGLHYPGNGKPWQDMPQKLRKFGRYMCHPESPEAHVRWRYQPQFIWFVLYGQMKRGLRHLQTTLVGGPEFDTERGSTIILSEYVKEAERKRKQEESYYSPYGSSPYSSYNSRYSTQNTNNNYYGYGKTSYGTKYDNDNTYNTNKNDQQQEQGKNDNKNDTNNNIDSELQQEIANGIVFTPSSCVVWNFTSIMLEDKDNNINIDVDADETTSTKNSVVYSDSSQESSTETKAKAKRRKTTRNMTTETETLYPPGSFGRHYYSANKNNKKLYHQVAAGGGSDSNNSAVSSSGSSSSTTEPPSPNWTNYRYGQQYSKYTTTSSPSTTTTSSTNNNENNNNEEEEDDNKKQPQNFTSKEWESVFSFSSSSSTKNNNSSNNFFSKRPLMDLSTLDPIILSLPQRSSSSSSSSRKKPSSQQQNTTTSTTTNWEKKERYRWIVSWCTRTLFRVNSGDGEESSGGGSVCGKESFVSQYSNGICRANFYSKFGIYPFGKVPKIPPMKQQKEEEELIKQTNNDTTSNTNTSTESGEKSSFVTKTPSSPRVLRYQSLYSKLKEKLHYSSSSVSTSKKHIHNNKKNKKSNESDSSSSVMEFPSKNLGNIANSGSDNNNQQEKVEDLPSVVATLNDSSTLDDMLKKSVEDENDNNNFTTTKKNKFPHPTSRHFSSYYNHIKKGTISRKNTFLLGNVKQKASKQQQQEKQETKEEEEIVFSSTSIEDLEYNSEKSIQQQGVVIRSAVELSSPKRMKWIDVVVRCDWSMESETQADFDFSHPSFSIQQQNNNSDTNNTTDSEQQDNNNIHNEFPYMSVLLDHHVVTSSSTISKNKKSKKSHHHQQNTTNNNNIKRYRLYLRSRCACIGGCGVAKLWNETFYPENGTLRQMVRDEWARNFTGNSAMIDEFDSEMKEMEEKDKVENNKKKEENYASASSSGSGENVSTTEAPTTSTSTTIDSSSSGSTDEKETTVTKKTNKKKKQKKDFSDIVAAWSSPSTTTESNNTNNNTESEIPLLTTTTTEDPMKKQLRIEKEKLRNEVIQNATELSWKEIYSLTAIDTCSSSLEKTTTKNKKNTLKLKSSCNAIGYNRCVFVASSLTTKKSSVTTSSSITTTTEENSGQKFLSFHVIRNETSTENNNNKDNNNENDVNKKEEQKYSSSCIPRYNTSWILISPKSQKKILNCSQHVGGDSEHVYTLDLCFKMAEAAGANAINFGGGNLPMEFQMASKHLLDSYSSSSLENIHNQNASSTSSEKVLSLKKTKRKVSNNNNAKPVNNLKLIEEMRAAKKQQKKKKFPTTTTTTTTTEEPKSTYPSWYSAYTSKKPVSVDEASTSVKNGCYYKKCSAIQILREDIPLVDDDSTSSSGFDIFVKNPFYLEQ